MAMNYIPLDKDKHQSLKINLKHNFEFAKDAHLAAASIREYAQLAGCMPLVLIKDPKSDNYHSIAMLGIEQDKNLYYAEEKWQAPAVPFNIQRYPFDVRPDGDKLGVFIDENSALITDDGEPLFTDAGEATELMKNRHKFLSELANSEMATQRFMKKIVELDLLDEIQIRVAYANGQQRNVTGIYSINEKKLHSLTDEQILELHKSGHLGAIYALLMSLAQLNRLVELSAKTDMPIRNLQLVTASRDEQKAEEKAAAETPTH